MTSSHPLVPFPPRARARSALAILASVAVLGSALGASLPAAAATSAKADAARDYTALVDPFVSTAGDDGNDLPGAEAPHSLAKVNPLTTPNRNHTGYDYNEDQIAGFTTTNLDGVGGSGGGGDILVVPTAVQYTARPASSTYAHDYSHDDETATPGYYQVGLGAIGGTAASVTKQSGTIDAQATTTTRTGVEQFAFPEGTTSPELVVDLANNFTSRTASSLTATPLADGTMSLSGTVTGSFNGANYALSYYATTTKPVTSLRSWGAAGTLSDATTQSGADTGAILTFAGADASDIGLRVTISPISAAQAKIDQQVELGDSSFDDIRTQTKDDWNETLGAVDVSSTEASDPDGTLTKEFYTHLYRMYAAPVNATSTSGTYRGVDGVVHKTNGYTYYDGWSSWDDFRKYSVDAYIDPAAYRDMVQSLVDLFADAHATGKSLSSLTQSVPTVRWERSAVIIADALSKGYSGFDRLDEAYPSIAQLTGFYTGAQLRAGYIPNDPGTTVGRGYDQWALAIIADALGRTKDAAKYRAQSELPIENLIKPDAYTAADGTQVGLLSPRDASGTWTSVDYEQFQAASLYQGTLWQYNWYDAYDMAGLIEAMGGDAAGKAAVEHMFGEDSTADDGSTMLHSNANEIDLQAPYLFNYVGEPSLTQKWVRAIYTEKTWNRYIATDSTGEAPSANGEFTPPVYRNVYSLSPEGFLPTMDNDAGTMSTMFVAAALGLFPVTAGSSQFQIGSPFFDSTTIHYADGTDFTVKADGVSASDYYVQSATLDGKQFDNTWLDYSQIIAGGTLHFTMGSRPSTWGENTAAPYSASTADGSTPATGDTTVTASTATIAADAQGALDGSTTLTLDGPATLAASAGTDLVATGDAAVSGLPTGVTATATVTDAHTLTLAVHGAITTDARISLTFHDSAFADGVSAATVTGAGVTATQPILLSAAAGQRGALQKLVDEASLVRKASYSNASFTVFQSALARAQTALADDASTTGTLIAALESLQGAADTLMLDEGGYRVLQAETPDGQEGASLKAEAYYSDGDMGGVTEGSWLRYDDLDFAGVAPQSLSIRYANSQAAANAPSSVDVHAGDANGPIVATSSLPGTNGWQYYSTVQADITDGDALLTAEQVTFVFHAPSGQQWVSNFDWFQFSPDPLQDSTEPTPIATLTAASATTTGGGTATLNTSNGIFENTTNGAYGEWAGTDLAAGADTITVSYDKPQSRAASDSAVEIHIGSKTGTPSVTIPLPYTGSTWGTIGTATATVDPSLFAGAKDVWALFTSTTQTDAQPYVANVYSVSFARSANTAVSIQAATWVSSSGGGLKSETSTWSDGTVTDLGGTYNGAWLDYGTLDFGSTAKNTVSIHYVNNSARCGANSAVQIYLDAFDSANPGTPYATVPLAVTGSSWTPSGTAAITLPQGIAGSHHVWLRLVTTPDANHPYVANLDTVAFTSVTAPERADSTALAAAIDQWESTTADADRYDTIEFAVFTRELAAAKALVDDADATQHDLDLQTRSLSLAGAQLVPRARLQLEQAVDAASALADERYTDETWSALQAALTSAKATDADTSATDATLSAARDALVAAQKALVTKAQVVPTAPTSVSSTATSTSVTVSWATPADDGGSAITGYSVALSDGDRITVSDPTQHSLTFSWLKPATSYTSHVTAVNALGESAPSASTPAVVTASAAAVDATVTSVAAHGTSVRVSWSIPAAAGAVVAYRVTLSDGTAALVPATETSALVGASSTKVRSATVAAVTTANALGESTRADAAVQDDPADYTPAPFTDAELNASYSSDTWPATADGSAYFTSQLRGMDDLDTTIAGTNEVQPLGEVTAQNDEIAVSINNAATQAQVDRAENDATHDSSQTMYDGLGSRLGPIYLDALNGGDLPKTSALFGMVRDGLDQGDTAKADYDYLRPYVRLGFVGDGGSIYESQDGSYSSLATQGSFPSGHTYGGYEVGTILATLLPELSASILARASEYGNNRIILGFHYPLDVMGGRMVAQATVAHRWADADFADLLEQAHTEIENVLLAQCEADGYGDTLTECSGDAYDGMTAAQDVDLYTQRLSYGFSQVGRAGVKVQAPGDAAALLETSFPELTTAQRTEILEQTATDSGYPLDLTSEGDASWQRINLAAAMTAQYAVNADGTVTVTNHADATSASVAQASSISVDGTALTSFDPATRGYVVDWPASEPLPVVTATATDGATVTTATGGALGSSLDGFASDHITVTSANGQHTTVYDVGFHRTADDHRPGALTIPVNSALPKLSGTARVGSTLKASTGTWKPTATRYTYQWYVANKAVSGATAASFTLPASAAGHTVHVKVTAIGLGGSGSASSKNVTAAKGVLTHASTPVVVGSVKVGSTVHVSVGTWSPKPTTMTYQWLVNGKVIPGATKSTYTIKSIDKGKRLSVRTTASKTAYTTVVVPSFGYTVQ